MTQNNFKIGEGVPIVSNSGFEKRAFYGKKGKHFPNNVKKLEDAEINNKLQKLPNGFHFRLNGPSNIWKVFFRQKDAFEFAEYAAKDAKVFSFESESFTKNIGQRQFLVTNYALFWHYYMQLDSVLRNHYEIIPENALCKLYFDLEFSQDDNPDSDGLKMVKVLKKYVLLCLKNILYVSCDSSVILDLDATTEKKFSHHLIFNIKNYCFQDNSQVGHFVMHIFRNWMHHYNNVTTNSKTKLPENDSGTFAAETSTVLDICYETQCKQLEDEKVTVLDKQHFKQGENSVESSHQIIQNSDSDIFDKIFLNFTEDETKCLVVKNKDRKDMLFCDLGVYTRNRNFRLFLSSKLNKANPLILAKENEMKPSSLEYCTNEKMFLDSLICNVEYIDKVKVLSWSCANQKVLQCFAQQHSKDSSCETLEGEESSPYPEIDSFIKKFMISQVKSSSIRNWTYFTEGELLIYETSCYRWCDNIKRQHKSNNVMLLADLRRGVFYQKCHDPQCKFENFKSKDYPLPAEVLPSYFFLSDVFNDNEDTPAVSKFGAFDDSVSVKGVLKQGSGSVAEPISDGLSSFLDDTDDDDMMITAAGDIQ